ncbi:MAG: chitobiase/beta-hexosaminidase C-terminal domain-containing protein [Patescibacteria group bacterium]
MNQNLSVRRFASRTASLFAVFAALLGFAMSAQATFAATCTFASAGTSDFNTSANWSCGHTPTVGDDVIIPAATSTSLSADVTVSTTTVDGTLDMNSFNYSASSTFQSFIIGSTGTMTVGNHTASASGTISIAAGGILNGGAIQLEGNWNDSGTYNGLGSIVFFVGSGAQTVSPEPGFFDLTINKPTGAVTLLGETTTTQDMDIVSGTLNLNGQTLHLGHAWSDSGTLVANGGTVDFNFASGIGQPVFPEANFGNITLTNNTIVGFFGDTTSTANVTISPGSTLILVTPLTFHVGGNWIDTGTLSSGTGAVDFNGTGAQSISAEANFYDLSVTKSSGTATLGGESTSTHDVTLNAGTLSLGSNTLHVGHDWNNNGGTLSGTGSVDLNGTGQAISGSTSFFNLYKLTSTADILTFQAGATTTATNALYLQGATGNLLSLRSSATGSQWDIDPQSLRSISNVDVEDSNNINVTAIVAGSSSIDSGNNINWSFTNPPGNPIISPVTGSYSSAQNVTITSTSSTSIRFTTNGTTPTCSVGTLYAGAFLISSSATVKAVGCLSGTASGISSVTYTITISGGGGGGGGGGLGSSGVVAIPSVTTQYQSYLANLQSIGVPVHSLVKLPCTTEAAAADVNDVCKAVYYIGTDGMRHAFPNPKVYFTWYQDFSGVQLISSDQLASIPLGKNVTYKPGVKMVKFTTFDNVYVVVKGGVLRWVKGEAVATALYGADWNTKIDDIPDTFHSNYTFGADVNGLSDFDPAAAQSSVEFPSDSL